jgi:hypothetical protein
MRCKLSQASRDGGQDKRLGAECEERWLNPEP